MNVGRSWRTFHPLRSATATNTSNPALTASGVHRAMPRCMAHIATGPNANSHSRSLGAVPTRRRSGVLRSQVMAFSVALLATGCAAADPTGEDLPEADEADQNHVPAIYEDTEANGAAAVSSEASGTGTTSDAITNLCGNCVLFARSRQPRLPYGLTYWSSKVNVINTQTPRAGCVAMIYTGSSYGHVAYVRSVTSTSVSLAEANWVHGACTSRTVARSYSRIRGYFCP